mgnify:CR=1 FL=1|tara:strand:+ start:36490 stop:37545 length:1056 start_codon:yes stop_codon:yes gene_type:complete
MEGQPELVPVLKAHRIDEGRLADCLGREDLLDGPLKVRQFQGGQSNPTYLLESGERRYVLRKKPPGKVLPSAHQVDREFRVMKALGEHSDVPVPRMRLFSDDEDVVGTSFYVMDFVPGRVYSHPQLEALPKEQRADLYHSSVDTLAKLHRVDYQAAGLGDFGRPQGYVARQVKRWSAQYQASQTDQLPAMDNLIDWLQEHIPAEDSAAIAHGDYRLGNLLVARDSARVVAVLDWELATIGHPLADLAYYCLPFHLPHGIQGVRGLDGLDLSARGIPDERSLLERYCLGSGRDGISDWPVYLAFALFRTAAILQGVYARALQGNASNRDALEVGKRAGLMAERGWQIARAYK